MRHTRVAVVALALTLAACAPSTDGPAANAPSGGTAEPTPKPPVEWPEPTAAPLQPPEGAIRVSDALYMVPMGEDDTGCPWYSAWSPTAATPAVMQYRAQGGGWTMNRLEADCLKLER